MNFEGALIKEQGLTFGLIVVKSYVLNDAAAQQKMHQFGRRVWGSIPVVLMAQDHTGRPDVLRAERHRAVSCQYRHEPHPHAALDGERMNCTTQQRFVRAVGASLVTVVVAEVLRRNVGPATVAMISPIVLIMAHNYMDGIAAHLVATVSGISA